ncbi:MAG: PSD1 and planctomycete cytochrome C domain-containing protein [Planctomycetota bacterium]
MNLTNIQNQDMFFRRWVTFSWVGVIVWMIAMTFPSTLLGQGSDQPTTKTTQVEANKIDANKLFTLKVLPLLRVKCFGCHGDDADDIRGELNLITREGMLKGGESGDPSLIPGDAESSTLYQAVMWDGYEMPPKENDRLTEEQTVLVRQWIDAGAPWPDEAEQKRIQQQEWTVVENADGVLVTNSGGLADDWTYRRYQPKDIWAFRPVNKPQLPNLEDGQNPIDYFIDRKLADKNIEAASTADPRTLIRRLSYDLVGLPPSPREIATFKKAWEADPQQAWNQQVDRLLASPQHGERWGQHWLDVVRYADTAGFSNDYERSNAWRYRDYVIRSFNDDKPYDVFVAEQIAGDEMSTDANPESAELQIERRIATGFLRMGPWGTAMIPQEEARQIYRDDLVHNVGQTFLAMPMRCCKCHDHKFDPIPTRDYYRMYATFATTQPAELPAPFLESENRSRFDENRKLVQELLDYAKGEKKRVIDKQEAAAKAWYEENGLPYKNENARKQDPEDKKPPRHVGLDPEDTGVKKVREQDVWIWERRLERFQPLIQSVYSGPDVFMNSRKLRPKKNNKPDWRPKIHILAGGSLEAELAPVGPGVLSGLGISVADSQVAEISTRASSNDAQPDRWSIDPSVEGRRLALANWIAHDKNPLTARTMVNRVWQSHFGTGLVKTSNNFGVKGDRPTHPELLDWLTADFVENGWRLKRLHRMIVTSNAYRRSSKPANMKHQSAVDPDNKLLGSFPPRRLTAEEIRDSLLKVTGELNLEMGGLPVMPEINMEVALQPRMIQFSIAPAHQPSRTPAERNRRTIYTYRVRGQADPFLEIMNLPNPNESCELRDSAAVTPQAFTLLNSDTITDRSIALALRVQDDLKNQPEVDTKRLIRRSIRLALGRAATQTEQDNLQKYYLDMVTYHQQNEPKEISYPTQVVRSLVEEFTGQPFEFIEKLNVYNDYQPDAKPWTVSAETRALADVCLLLMNTNEFLYVY